MFSNEVDTDAHAAVGLSRPGRWRELRTHRDAFVGYVGVNPHALICARILSQATERPVDAALLEARLRAALALRERSGAGAVLPLGVW